MADTTTLDEWLQARHSKWNTPASLINEYVRKATGSAIEQASRVVLGVDNEVYDVTTAGNHRLIVRISHKENHRFEAVSWDAYWSELVPTNKLLASYGNQSVFTESYDTLFHLVLLRESLIMLMVHAARKNPNGIQGFITEMERAF